MKLRVRGWKEWVGAHQMGWSSEDQANKRKSYMERVPQRYVEDPSLMFRRIMVDKFV